MPRFRAIAPAALLALLSVPPAALARQADVPSAAPPPSAPASLDTFLLKHQAWITDLSAKASAHADAPPRAADLLPLAPGSDRAKRSAHAMEAWTSLAATGEADRSVLYGLPTGAERSLVAAAALALLEVAPLAESAAGEALALAERADAEAEPEPELVRVKSALAALRRTRAINLLAALAPNDAIRRELGALAAAEARRAEPTDPWSNAQQGIELALAQLAQGEGASAVRTLAEAKRGAEVNEATRMALAPDLLLGAVLITAAARDAQAALEALSRTAGSEPWRAEGQQRIDLEIITAELHLRLSRIAADSAEPPDARERFRLGACSAFERIYAAERPAPELPEARRRVLRELGPIVTVEEAAVSPTAAVARAVWLRETKDQTGIKAVLGPWMESGRDLGLLRRPALTLWAECLAEGSADEAALGRAIDAALAVAREAGDDGWSAHASAAAERAAEALDGLPSDDPAVRAARRERHIGTLRALHQSPLDSARLARARAMLIRLLTDGVAQQRAQTVLLRVREAEGVAGALREAPEALAAARLVVARAWLEVESRLPYDPEGYAEAGYIEQTGPRQALANTAVAESALAAAQSAGVGDAANLAVLAHESRAVAIEAHLALGETTDAWAKLNAEPAIDLGALEHTSLLQSGMRASFLADEVDSGRIWLGRFTAAEPARAKLALAELSTTQWHRVGLSASGFAADAEPMALGAWLEVQRAAADWTGWSNADERREFQRRLAWSLVLAGDGDGAARIFTALVEAAPTRDLLRGLGEAKLRGGREADAFAAFKRLAEDPDGAREQSRESWHAWTRMVEILARQNTDGSRSADIRRELARLRALPSAAQHADCIGRLARVERILDTAPAP